MCLQPFYGEGPHRLLRAGSRAASGKINGTPYRPNYCVISIAVAYPGILFGGVQQIQLRTEDRDNGDLGAVAL